MKLSREQLKSLNPELSERIGLDALEELYGHFSLLDYQAYLDAVALLRVDDKKDAMLAKFRNNSSLTVFDLFRVYCPSNDKRFDLNNARLTQSEIFELYTRPTPAFDAIMYQGLLIQLTDIIQGQRLILTDQRTKKSNVAKERDGLKEQVKELKAQCVDKDRLINLMFSEEAGKKKPKSPIPPVSPNNNKQNEIIRQLKEFQAVLKEKLSESEEQIRESKQIQNEQSAELCRLQTKYRTEIDQLQEENNRLSIDLSAEVVSKKVALSVLDKKYKEIFKKQTELDDSFDRLRLTNKGLGRQVNQLTAELKTKQAKCSELQNELADIRQKFNDLLTDRDVNKLRTEIANLKQDLINSKTPEYGQNKSSTIRFFSSPPTCPVVNSNENQLVARGLFLHSINWEPGTPTNW